MKQTGILVTCDRCGKEHFISDDGTGDLALVRYHSSGWRKVDDKDICPGCVKEYKKIEERVTYLERQLMKDFWECKEI